MEQRLISFRKLRLRCDCRMYEDVCYEVGKPCTAKNCPVWAKLMTNTNPTPNKIACCRERLGNATKKT